ncbi:hypothetical protein F2P79_009869 [Pimephales promelas]|nr:hypothetical protein F2P79_009869 [Pimephales promelas]
MNSMFSVWTLSSLILSYTLAFPIFNNTSRGSYMETFPNVTEIMEDNITRLMENFANISGLNERRELFVKFEIKPVIDLARGEPLSICGRPPERSEGINEDDEDKMLQEATSSAALLQIKANKQSTSQPPVALDCVCLQCLRRAALTQSAERERAGCGSAMTKTHRRQSNANVTIRQNLRKLGWWGKWPVLDDFCDSALPEQHSPAPRQIFSLHQVFAVVPTDGLEPEPTNECGRHFPDPSVHESRDHGGGYINEHRRYQRRGSFQMCCMKWQI